MPKKLTPEEKDARRKQRNEYQKNYRAKQKERNISNEGKARDLPECERTLKACHDRSKKLIDELDKANTQMINMMSQYGAILSRKKK